MQFNQGKAQGAKASIQGRANEQALINYVEASVYGQYIRTKIKGTKKNPILVLDRKLPSEATPHGGDYTEPDMLIDLPSKTIAIEQKSQESQGSCDIKTFFSIFQLSHLLKKGYCDQAYLLIRGFGWKKGWREFMLSGSDLLEFIPSQGYGEKYLQSGKLIVCTQEDFVRLLQTEKL